MNKKQRRPTWFLIAVIFSFLIIIGAMYLFSRNLIVQKQLQILELNRDVATSKINGELNEIKSIIVDIDSYIVSQSGTQGMLDYMMDIDDRYDVIYSIYFGMPDQSMINTSGFVPPPGFDLTSRPWYQLALTSEDVVFTNAFVNATNDRVIITAAYSVYENDTLLGVIGADIDVRDFTSFINDIDYPENAMSFMVDGNENVIAEHGITGADAQLASSEDWGIPVSALSQTGDMSGDLDINDIPGRIAYDSIAGTTYTFGIFMSNSDLAQSTRIFWLISFAVLLILFAVGGSTIFIYYRYIQMPSSTLITDIGQVTPHDGYRYRFPEDNHTGFTEIRHAFNDLLDKTVEYQTQARMNFEELIVRNQKYNLLLDSAPDIVFQMDTEFRYTEVYGQALSILNLKESDMVGKTFSQVYGIELGKERLEHVREAFKGNKSVYTWSYHNGEYLVHLESVISPLYDINNEIIGVMGVTRDITEQQMRYEEMVYISNHDYLTGLYNQRYYIHMLEKLDKEKSFPFTVINIDFNGLKIINDAYGHAVGDQALIRTAEILTRNSPDDFVISRVSGDEFTIIMPHCDQSHAKDHIETILNGFNGARIGNIDLSIAIGFCVKSDTTISLDDVRKLAENDMYRHKILERKSIKNKAISAILKTLTEKYEAERIHSDRVSDLSVKLGEVLGLAKSELLELKTAALFHDIGKISIPDDIVNKPGKLTPEEFEIMKSHTEVGYEILRAADEYSQLAIYASSHHERYDGKGYPNGLSGKTIPLFSRIISLADAYEAMTSNRPYRKAMSEALAIKEIIQHAGTQFDPELAKLFVEGVLHQPFKL